jgi:hypothetical protein
LSDRETFEKGMGIRRAVLGGDERQGLPRCKRRSRRRGCPAARRARDDWQR